MSKYHTLELIGVEENNLKDIDLSIPHDKLVVITGVSGSGKSSLAFSTIYAEGGRRYIETFNPYTRQFLDRLHRPQVKTVHGVRPALALEQRRSSGGARSTVGTATEINDYLKLIWAQLSQIACPICLEPMPNLTPQLMAQNILNLLSNPSTLELCIGFALPPNSNISWRSICQTMMSLGFSRYFDTTSSQVRRLDEAEHLVPHQDMGSVQIVVDRFRGLAKKLGKDEQRSLYRRILSSVNECLRYGHGAIFVLQFSEKSFDRLLMRPGFHCLKCAGTKADKHALPSAYAGHSFPPPKPSMFSFNSPLGACPTCKGFGNTLEVNPDLVAPNPQLSIKEGAISCWTTKAATWERRTLLKFCDFLEIDITKPWSQLSQKNRNLILQGSPAYPDYPGVIGWFRWLETKRYKMHVRVFLSFYRSEVTCPDCQGLRLKPLALPYKIAGLSIGDFWQLSIAEARHFLQPLLDQTPDTDPCYTPLVEACSRLDYLCAVGLPYLTLNRQMKTLSGGESQRVNLTSLIGSRLCNTMVVLDEPTIGLHHRDTALLLQVMYTLRDQGNSVLVVEHDRDVITAADEVIDIGPGSGNNGGKVVFQGPPEELARIYQDLQTPSSDNPVCSECPSENPLKICQASPDFSFTAKYLAQPPQITSTPKPLKTRGQRLSSRSSLQEKALSTSVPALRIVNARAHNLKNICVDIPLHRLVVVSGVSGSGKSTLLEQCLYETYVKLQQGHTIKTLASRPQAPLSDLQGLDLVQDILLVDQSPVGRNPRANTATYSGAWDDFRQALSQTQDATTLGLSASAFSFNVDGGRCPTCKGAGSLKVEMQFLSDVFVECEACRGSRFQDKVLTVRLGNKNVSDLLHTTIEEAVTFAESSLPEKSALNIKKKLNPLIKLGLGYLTLGQSLNELSGGEAQRLKLASYLIEGNKQNCLFILDEPTTGLHPANIETLLAACRQLIDNGHSIVCIEHNLDVIAGADWLIDLGPEGGISGGEVLATGTPSALLNDPQAQKLSATISALARSQKESSAKRVSNKIQTASISITSPSKHVYTRKDHSQIGIVGARHHNLKNVSVEIPKNLITCITGVSGSGKSSLAFDILFAEGQRRYIDCLSPYARQFIKQLERPDVDQVYSIPPTIAVSQKTAPPAGISTIGTTTEIYQFLRLLFAKAGVQHCPEHKVALSASSPQALAEQILEDYKGERVYIFAPVVTGRKGNYQALFQRALAADISQAIIDGRLESITSELSLDRHKLHWVSLLVGSVSCNNRNAPLLTGAIEQALLLSGGDIEIALTKPTSKRSVLSTARVCPVCRQGFRELDPQDFSFRSARGMCPKCSGRGYLDVKNERRNCPLCQGTRLGQIAQSVLIENFSIHSLALLTPCQLSRELGGLCFPSRLDPVVQPILREIQHRLEIMNKVGLDYLSLDRESSTLSGGEAQRLRLARSLGSPLSGVCYILDEPTIGLHPADHELVVSLLRELRDQGNSIVIVEHDPDTIAMADHIVDLGPGGGAQGGQIVAQGTLSDIIAEPRSATGQAFVHRDIHKEAGLKPASKLRYFRLEGASANNLRSVDVSFALGALNVVCGVSGAGKSSLVHQTLIPALTSSSKRRKSGKTSVFESISGHEEITRVIELDQTPLGKTPSSTPASYLGILDELRKLYALMPEAKARGWTARHFSYNSGAGRCQQCEGKGFIKVPMSFLPDAVSVCESCNGLRYNDPALEVEFQGFSIGAMLRLTINQARQVLANCPRLHNVLSFVDGLGLGYLSLGQPTYTVSGGEAQRLKIAVELSRPSTKHTLYVLDEPTVGLHMADVERLYLMLRQLVERGNTVVVIEHDLAIISRADHLLELGPGAGDKGGRLLYAGSPCRLYRRKNQTPTGRALEKMESSGSNSTLHTLNKKQKF